MSMMDSLVSLVAPHICVGCGSEGSVLCSTCLIYAGEPPPPRCAGCKALSDGYKTCRSCRHWLDIYAVYVATNYEGMYEQLLRNYKFDVQRQAAGPISKIMLQATPPFQENQLVMCPLPTAPRRIRRRGFDHARLLAREFWRQLPQKAQAQIVLDASILSRRSNKRQLGASRATRIDQMKDEFFVQNPEKIQGQTVLLLDDVTTTGASLAAAAKALKTAGAKRVYAVVYAQKI